MVSTRGYLTLGKSAHQRSQFFLRLRRVGERLGDFRAQQLAITRRKRWTATAPPLRSA